MSFDSTLTRIVSIKQDFLAVSAAVVCIVSRITRSIVPDAKSKGRNDVTT